MFEYANYKIWKTHLHNVPTQEYKYYTFTYNVLQEVCRSHILYMKIEVIKRKKLTKILHMFTEIVEHKDMTYFNKILFIFKNLNKHCRWYQDLFDSHSPSSRILVIRLMYCCHTILDPSPSPWRHFWIVPYDVFLL